MRRGTWQQKLADKIRSTAGMTLIELIVGLAVASVVSVMAAQFFSIAVRLHRTSTEISAIQKEAQTIQSALTRAVMGASELYFYDNGRENYLMVGRETTERDKVGFAGQIFYYDRAERKFYMDTDYTVSAQRQTLFNSLRAQSEIGRIRNDDYLVSNKVEEMIYTLTGEGPSQGGQITQKGRDGRTLITVDLTMQYHESRSYHFETRVMPRETLREIAWSTSR